MTIRARGVGDKKLVREQHSRQWATHPRRPPSTASSTLSTTTTTLFSIHPTAPSLHPTTSSIQPPNTHSAQPPGISPSGSRANARPSASLHAALSSPLTLTLLRPPANVRQILPLLPSPSVQSQMACDVASPLKNAQKYSIFKTVRSPSLHPHSSPQSPSCLPYPMPLPSPQKVRSLLPCHPPPHLPLARTCVVTGDNGQVNGLVTENATPLHPELQSARCMSNRYRLELFPRCVSCTRRWAGDTCRFQGIRFFLKDKQHEIVGISFLGSRYQDAPKMLYPIKWNVPLQEAHVNRMKVCIYVLLLLHSSILLLPFIG